MNPAIKTEWIKRLRSGEYQQGYQRLRIDDPDGAKYCCLGVLCEMAVEAGVATRHWSGYRDVSGEEETDGALLIDAIQQWAGLDSDSAQIRVPEGTQCPYSELPDERCEEPLCYVCRQTDRFGISLTELNDDKKSTFNEIADVIEKFF